MEFYHYIIAIFFCWWTNIWIAFQRKVLFFDHLSIGGIISIVAFFQKKDKRIDSWKFSFSVTIFVCMYVWKNRYEMARCKCWKNGCEYSVSSIKLVPKSGSFETLIILCTGRFLSRSIKMVHFCNDFSPFFDIIFFPILHRV